MSDLFGFQDVSTTEVSDLVIMARQSYENEPENVNSWINITGQIGLDPAFLGQAGLSYVPVSNILGDGGEAVVYRNNATNTVAIAFQGTADLADVLTSYISTLTLPEISVIPLYSDLILALDLYLLANPAVDRLLLTGQSIGGTLAQGVKSAFSEGRPNLSEISAVTFANPSLNLDSGVLHIGIEGDPIYRLVNNITPGPGPGIFEPVETTGLRVDFAPDVPSFLGGVPLLDRHDPQVYAETVQVLSASIFANSEAQDIFIDTLPNQQLDFASIFPEMNLDSNILVSLNPELLTLATGAPSDLPLFVLAGDEYEANIGLDGNGDSIFEGGEKNDSFVADQDDSGSNVLIGKGGNDVLVGGNRQDLIIGGEGSDTLQGGLGADFLIGGKGDDTLIGGSSSDPDLSSDDFVYYAGSPDEYLLIPSFGEPGLLPGVTVIDTVDDRDGVDSLIDIEVLSFGSGDFLRIFPTPASGVSDESIIVIDDTLLDSSAMAFSFNSYRVES